MIVISFLVIIIALHVVTLFIIRQIANQKNITPILFDTPKKKIPKIAPKYHTPSYENERIKSNQQKEGWHE